MTELNRYIDHTILKAGSSKEQVKQIIDEAKEHNFFSVCLNPTWVEYAAEELKDSEVKVCTVIGFPLGANTSELKAFETKDAVAKGADEVDMVINIDKVKSNDYDYVLNDIKAVVDAAGEALVKVIIETALLTDEEKVKVCELAKEAGADYVKTSTGFSIGGATQADVKLMRETVGPDMGVKASGGISTTEDALGLIENGATRLGASKGIQIIQGQK